jgi:hypothetical protein
VQPRDLEAGQDSAKGVPTMVKRPRCPYSLAAAGRSWWRWAWSTDQARRWDASALYTVARRAQLEDERAALAFVDGLDLADLLAGADAEAVRRVEFALATLKRCATGGVALSKEMRELETQLGLGPKASAGLGWKPEEPRTDKLDELSTRRATRIAGGSDS